MLEQANFDANNPLPPAAAQFSSAAGIGELLRVEGLRKTFRSGSAEITPLDNVDFSIAREEMVAIVGPSGAGKSTFLHSLAALDTPTSGTIYFERNSLEALAEHELAEYRNHSVGFVWQRHHLLPDFTSAENVAMPLLISGVAREAALRSAGEIGRASCRERVSYTV